ncbi:Coenzyme Q-binding protein [Ceratobasidium theobromae]|uniref:Coenzyme Q-binding protein n=1 Tax=Ceratobasidium theobromae TaxID=1582974 RepID=A0A5N5QKP9_9AGAM|nr:Coenzyme Q-binding protein [Ceratobasidium theobromae]
MATTLRPFARTFFSSSGPATRFHSSKILPYVPLIPCLIILTPSRYTQRQLYNLVADVNAYHHFLPFCTNSRVLTPPPAGFDRDAPYQVEAELEVGFMGLKESYVSLVRCIPWASVQAIATSSTPLFKHLETTWRFHPTNIPPSANVHPGPDTAPALLTIDLHYEFANPVHAVVSNAAFERVSGMMVDAFEKRTESHLHSHVSVDLLGLALERSDDTGPGIRNDIDSHLGPSSLDSRHLVHRSISRDDSRSATCRMPESLMLARATI